jgi:hypothetical protein
VIVVAVAASVWRASVGFATTRVSFAAAASVSLATTTGVSGAAAVVTIIVATACRGSDR